MRSELRQSILVHVTEVIMITHCQMSVTVRRSIMKVKVYLNKINFSFQVLIY